MIPRNIILYSHLVSHRVDKGELVDENILFFPYTIRRTSYTVIAWIILFNKIASAFNRLSIM